MKWIESLFFQTQKASFLSLTVSAMEVVEVFPDCEIRSDDCYRIFKHDHLLAVNRKNASNERL